MLETFVSLLSRHASYVIVQSNTHTYILLIIEQKGDVSPENYK